MQPPSKLILACPSCPVNVHHYHPCGGLTKDKEVTIAESGICSANEISFRRSAYRSAYRSVNQSLLGNLMSLTNRACRVCGMKMQAETEKTLQPIPEDMPVLTFTTVVRPLAPAGVGPSSGTAPPVDPPAVNRDPPKRDMVMPAKRRRKPSAPRKLAKRSRTVKKEKKEPYTACMARASDDGYYSDESVNSIA